MPIINPEAAAAAACPALRDSIVMTIISNTSAELRVPAKELEGLLEMAKEFGKSNFILVQRGTNTKEFCFEAEDCRKNLKLLTELLGQLQEAKVCDMNHITYEGKSYYGFCWNEKTSNGKDLFCGCYHFESEFEAE